MRRLPPIILFFVMAPIALLGQKLTTDPANSSIKITGTSSLHDWESEAQSFDIAVTMDNNLLKELNGSIQVKSIKSGKSIMDEKTYDALGADKFPDIKFQANQLEIKNGKVTGKVAVTIKGVTQSYDLSSSSTLTGGNVKVTGSVPLDMTAFGIEPPTAMFGTLETGKDVTINFQITLKQ